MIDPDNARQRVVTAVQPVERRRTDVMRAHLAAIVESSDDAILTKTLDGIITSWNPAAERLFGYRADEIVGRSVSMIVPPDRRRELRSTMAKLRRGERVHPIETVRLHRDGRRLNLSIGFSPVRDGDGQLIGASAIARDITAKRQAEEERRRLLAQEHKARLAAERLARRLALLQSVTDECARSVVVQDVVNVVLDQGLAALDAVGGAIAVLDANQKDLVLRGTVAPTLGSTYSRFSIYAPVLLAEAVRRGETIVVSNVGDWIVQHPSTGTARPVPADRTAVALPLVREERILGALELTFAAVRDFDEDEREFMAAVTQQCAQALDRALLYEQLQTALRSRDDFLAMASHEFGTPLTALTIQLQMLDRMGDDDASERWRRAVTGMQRQVARLNQLVTKLLDVRAIVGGQLELQPSHVDLGLLVHGVVERMRDDPATRADIQVHCRQSVVGQWDPVRLEQVITNLLSNADKYGNGQPIDVEVDRYQGLARLRVRDRGMGIAPADQGRIFERFERAAGTDRPGGLGLGLYIARTIVERHHGSIAVESEPGVGSVFTVVLPMS